MEPTRYRIDNTKTIFILSATLVVDFIQAILNLSFIGPFVNWIITLNFYLLLWFTFRQLGIKYTKNQKNNATMLAGFILEIIPFLDILPGWTISSWILIRNSHQEDNLKKSNESIESQNHTITSQSDSNEISRTVGSQKPALGQKIVNTEDVNGTIKQPTPEESLVQPIRPEIIDIKPKTIPVKSEPKGIEKNLQDGIFEDIIMTNDSPTNDSDPYQDDADNQAEAA